MEERILECLGRTAGAYTDIRVPYYSILDRAEVKTATSKRARFPGEHSPCGASKGHIRITCLTTLAVMLQ